jgi:hypothetical protein
MMAVRRSKNEMALMSLIFKNDASSLALRVTSWLFEFVDTPGNGLLSLFGIDSVHQMETSLSHTLLVYYQPALGSHGRLSYV